MHDTAQQGNLKTRRPVPRGIATSGPALLSYGFRPFFLGAGLFALIAMIIWIGALVGYWQVGGASGPIAWHAHEMLFGYAGAALTGFVLTTVPNWTGRLPVSGGPLAWLAALWLAGRLTMAFPFLLGETASAVIDSLFLPVLAGAVAREVIVGKNWKNLRVTVGILVLAMLNIAFHLSALAGYDEMPVLRLTIIVFIVMITLIGGRLIPSFTRNYLARRGAIHFPRPAGRMDDVILLVTLAAGLIWCVWPQGLVAAALAGLAAVLHVWRLAGWRGWTTGRNPLLLVLHIGYGFVPLGLAAIALAALDLMAEPSALHLLTVGAIGLMTLAVMTRATRGHTGRALAASPTTNLAYISLFAAALSRPLAELVPLYYQPLLELSAGAFILAYLLFVIEHLPMLVGPSLHKKG